MANRSTTHTLLPPGRLRRAVLCFALLPTLCAAASAPATRGDCANQDAMARFTLECVNTSGNTLYDCYNVAEKIYCNPPAPAPSPAKAAPPPPAAPPAKAAVPKAAAPAKKPARAKKK